MDATDLNFDSVDGDVENSVTMVKNDMERQLRHKGIGGSNLSNAIKWANDRFEGLGGGDGGNRHRSNSPESQHLSISNIYLLI